MNPRDMNHQHGIREQASTRAENVSKTIVQHIKTKKGNIYSTHSRSKKVIRSGDVIRDIHTEPVGGKLVLLRMAVQRHESKDSGHVSHEHVHFAAPPPTITMRQAKYAV